MTAIERLRKDHPWPTTRPASTRPVEGWLDKGNKRALVRSLRPDAHVVVELGSWLGLSALFFAEKAPGATIICVDTWKGSSEHVDDAKLRDTLARLYESFIANVWHVRQRVIPIRALSWDGLAAIHAAGVRPDLIYVDASHRQEDVERDLETAIKLFPDAALLGDDWSWSSVRRGAMAVAGRHGRRIRISHNCYELEPTAAGAPGWIHKVVLRTKIAWRVLDQSVVWPVVRRIAGRRDSPMRPR